MAKIIYPGHDAPFIGKGDRVEYLGHPQMTVRTLLADGQDVLTTIALEWGAKEGL